MEAEPRQLDLEPEAGGAPTDSPNPEISETHHDVTASGVRLRVTEWNHPNTPADQRPLIALPGVLSPRTSLRGVAREMCSAFRVIAVDLPGLGESERPSAARYPYTIPKLTEALADLFGALGLSRANLLGHGVGGAVALHLAARHAELVERLCLLAPHAELAGTSALSRLLLAPVIGGLVFRQFAGRSLFRRLYRTHINPSASSASVDDYYEILSQPAARAAILAILRNSQDTRRIIADSRRLRAQCLLVWGMQDRVFPVEHGRRLAREMPEAGLELLELGHAPHEEAPEILAPILVRFFEGRRAGFG